MPKKNQKPTPEYDSQRETRVLLKQIKSEVKVVAKQHGDIMKKFDVMKQRFDRVENVLMENGLQTKRIGQKLDTVIDNHETRIHKIETKISV